MSKTNNINKINQSVEKYKDFYTDLEYFDGTIFEKLLSIAEKYPSKNVIQFADKNYSYSTLINKIYQCANMLSDFGVKKDDCITLCLVNCPQAVYLIYAINLLGAICNICHPLSSINEIKKSVEQTGSNVLVMHDIYFKKNEDLLNVLNIDNIFLVSIQNDLLVKEKLLYNLKNIKTLKKIKNDRIFYFDNLLEKYPKRKIEAKRASNDDCCILYTGGTTGSQKGVCLTNYNFNVLSEHIGWISSDREFNDKALSVLPIFHGFGLGAFLHSMITVNMKVILVPRFNAKNCADIINRERCNYIAGVPALFEKWIRLKNIEHHDYSCIKGIYCGGDTLTPELRDSINKFLKEHNCSVQVRQGYGLTETIAICCLCPMHCNKENCIGIPSPDIYMKIVEPNTENEVPVGVEGEILVSGPLVMRQYYKQDEETHRVLKKHSDGLTWLHTGDLAYVDNDGFYYFTGRIKRVIISSGYNIYPSQVENILENVQDVEKACVVGAKDDIKSKVIVAFVQAKNKRCNKKQLEDKLIKQCASNLPKYAMPKKIIFIENFPLTSVKKVDYRKLEEFINK